MIKDLILKALKPLERRGIQFTMRGKILPDEVKKDIYKCSFRSWCSFTRFDAVWRALEYVNENGIQGDVVLCGVSHGGLAKFMSMYLGFSIDRKLWLYDTFDGGTAPNNPKDSTFDRETGGKIVKKKTACDFEEVKSYVNSNACHWIQGDILKTIPEKSPKKIAVLYLDTDWYESTYHELAWLEPKVSKRGIIIQDEMGLSLGAKNAVEDYYRNKSPKPFFTPIDEAAFMWIKYD